MTRVASAAIVLVATILGAVDAAASSPPSPNATASADASSDPSSLPSACGHDTSRPLVARAGVVTDGSGANGLYLPRTNCSWVIAPAPIASDPGASASGGVTLVFERLSAVLDDDFLFVSDASASLSERPDGEDDARSRIAQKKPARPLAAYTGALPVPLAVRFENVQALRLDFVTRGENRDAGFLARYAAGAECPGGCGGPERGVCANGRCYCLTGWSGADCLSLIHISEPTRPY